MDELFSRHERIAFQFSGGRDSLAALYLLRPYWARMTVYHLDTGDQFPEHREVVRRVAAELPDFRVIRGRLQDSLAAHGLPSDIIPTTHHSFVGQAVSGATFKVQVIEARYRTGPSGGTESPSRTAVSLDGRFVIVNNRGTGSSAVIAANLDDCKDKNGNGTIETSKNKNDLLAWQADECQMWSVQHPFKGDIGSGPRGVTWTPGTFDQVDCVFKDPKIWVGVLPVANATAHMVRLDGMTVAVEETLVINNWTQGDTFWGPYGAALDKDKNVWFTGLRGELFRITTSNNPATFDRWSPPPATQSYGMTVDPDGDPWHGGCSGPVTTFDPKTQTFTPIAGTNACHRGLAADHDGNVWVASNGPCGLVQIDHKTNQLIKFHNLNPCSTPVGVSVDLEGFVWLVDEAGWAWNIDLLNVPAMKKVDIIGDHYTYSDMTGGQLKSVVLPQ